MNFGDTLKPKDWRNPEGNFEDFPMSRLNQKLLAAFGSTWSAVKELPDEWPRLEPFQPLVEALRDRLEKRLKTRGLYGLKDPRLVPLFPIYRQVLKDLGVQEHLVVVRRRKEEVLSSIRASGYYHGVYTDDLGEELYAHYMRLLSEIEAQNPTSSVSYNTLVTRSETEIYQLCEKLPFAAFGQAARRDAAAQTIDKKLHRHRFEYKDA